MRDFPLSLRRADLPPGSLRYSPQPLESYSCKKRDFICGPAASMLLKRSVSVWNLAWLGFDYEFHFDHPFHPDPAYNVRVYHSSNYVMAARSVDISALAPDEVKLAGMLRYPAEEFVDWVVSSGIYKQLPLYHQYGDAWIETIRQRAPLAQADYATELTRSTLGEMSDLSDAEDLLRQFRL